VPSTEAEETAEIGRFTHLGQHLFARRAGVEYSLVPDCWDLVWNGLDSLPPWAERLIEAGEPGSRWCPVITPGFRTRA
jgi:hypothetical protein